MTNTDKYISKDYNPATNRHFPDASNSKGGTIMKYRTFLFLILVVLVLSGTAMAKPIIKADSTSFDVSTGQYLLKGNVSVQVNNRTITAGEAKVSIWSLEVWGAGGITLTQDDTYFSGDTVYVNGSQNSARVNGNVVFKRADLTITADEADFNWRTKQGVFTGNVRVTQGDNTWTTDSLTYNVETNAMQ